MCIFDVIVEHMVSTWRWAVVIIIIIIIIISTFPAQAGLWAA
jgi:hypothetical protein